jgi:hypothetical protein
MVESSKTKISIFTKDDKEYYSYLNNHNRLVDYREAGRPDEVALYDMNCLSQLNIKYDDIQKILLYNTNIELDVKELRNDV